MIGSSNSLKVVLQLTMIHVMFSTSTSAENIAGVQNVVRTGRRKTIEETAAAVGICIRNCLSIPINDLHMHHLLIHGSKNVFRTGRDANGSMRRPNRYG